MLYPKKMQNILGLLGLLTVSAHLPDDYMMIQWFIGLSVCAIMLGVFVAKAVNWLPATLFTYILINGIFVFASRWNYFSLHAHEFIYPASLRSLSVTTTVLVLVISSATISGNVGKAIFNSIPAFTLINSMSVIASFLLGKKLFGNSGYVGFLDNASTNGCLIAACFGFLVVNRMWFFSAISLLAIIVSNSSMPYGVLAAVLVGIAIKKRSRLALLSLAPVFLVGQVFEKENFFNSSGRFQAYKLFMAEWWDKGLIWFGTGLGSFNFLGPTIQCKHGYLVTITNGMCSGSLFTWLHSDWLELLFTTGIVGFLLGALVFLSASYRLLKYDGAGDIELFSLWLGLNAFAMFNFPAQSFVVSFMFIFVLVSAYRLTPVPGKTDQNPQVENH